ncbi:MAG: VWA domain-containing protein [Desulfobacteraceae bacterium]|nr:VWA domain-containing protein [Desulfobacteraceae bacterium]
MSRHHWCIALAAAVLVFACGEEPPPPTPPPAPAKPAAKAPAPPAPPAAETGAPAKPRVWPYLSQEYKVAIADNLLARNIVLIFDGSGSMKDVNCSGGLSKNEAAKKAVLEWSSTVPADANLGLVAFHAGSRGLTVQELAAGSRERFMQTVQRIQPGGKTPLTLSIKKALLMLEKQAQKQLGYGDYTIVVVTDGIANDPQALMFWVNQVLEFTPINIFTIGFCISGNHSLNQPGRTDYRAADNPEQLRKGLQESLAESETFDATTFE